LIERLAMLSEQLLGILWICLKVTRPAPWRIPGQNQAEHFRLTALNAACRSARGAADLDERVNLHTLRQSFGANLLERGADICCSQIACFLWKLLG
jgi:integrase